MTRKSHFVSAVASHNNSCHIYESVWPSDFVNFYETILRSSYSYQHHIREAETEVCEHIQSPDRESEESEQVFETSSV